MGEAGAPMQYLLELWNEWEIQVVVVASLSLQVILFFFAGIRRYSVSSLVKFPLWLVYLLADIIATYALGHISSLSKKSSSKLQLVVFWAPFLLLHLGGQDTITAYALEDNELWLRHLLNMFVQVAGTAYVLYKYNISGGATFVRAAMLVLAAGFVKYGERIWALKLASKGGSRYRRSRYSYGFVLRIYDFFFLPSAVNARTEGVWCLETMQENKFGTYSFIVMAAHRLRHVLVKPLIIDRNEASINWGHPSIALLHGQGQGLVPIRRELPGKVWKNEEVKDASAEEVYKAIEMELTLMYEMLYTKAEVIHTWYGHCIRAISLTSCFAALVVFTKSKRDVYSTSDIVITFALLGGACALEMASVIKAIGSTWTCALLRRSGWKWLPSRILLARYRLLLVEDGRWSNSVGQYNFVSFCARDRTKLSERIASHIGLEDLWNRARYTKHVKLSPAIKEFLWDLLRGEKSHMVQIEDVAIRSGYWVRRFRGFDRSEQLDWSLGFEFQKSVLTWHIATCTFLSNPAVISKLKLVDKDNDMAKTVSTLSDYMLYLLVKHPDVLPIKVAARGMFGHACSCYYKDGQSKDVPHKVILDYKDGHNRPDKITKLYGDLTQAEWDDYPGEAVLVKACTLAQIMLDMELGLTHMIVIIGTVWTEMLCYAANNVTGDFHARQLSNGGEFLTHILLLTQYSTRTKKGNKHLKAADGTVEASAAGGAERDVENGFKEEITETY